MNKHASLSLKRRAQMNERDRPYRKTSGAGGEPRPNAVGFGVLLSIESNNIAATLDPIHRLDAKDSLLKTVAANPRLATILRGHTDSIASVAFSPNGKTLASGGFDGSVRLWDVTSAQPVGGSVMRHTDWVRAVAFSPDGKILASGGRDSAVQPVGMQRRARRRRAAQCKSGQHNQHRV